MVGTAGCFVPVKRLAEKISLLHSITERAEESLSERKFTVDILSFIDCAGEIFDFLITNGRMKESDVRAKFRQVLYSVSFLCYLILLICEYLIIYCMFITIISSSNTKCM